MGQEDGTNILQSGSIDLTHTVLKLRDDGILQCEYKDGFYFTIRDVREVIEASGVISKGERIPVLNIPGKHTSLDPEARKFIATEECSRYTLIEAFIIRSMAHRLIANFYIRFDKPLVPTRFFDDQADAVNWLKKRELEIKQGINVPLYLKK